MPEIVYVLLGALLSFATALAIGPFAIKLLHRLKFGQSIRSEGPQSHLKKAGTPTMGGVIILVALLVGILVVGKLTTEVVFLLLLTVGFGIIGLIDDLIIVITKRNLGLTARQKLFAQIVLATVAAVFLSRVPSATTQLIPFTNLKLTFPVLSFNPLFLIFAAFVIVSESNAVNLTDGLDGLAGGTVAIAVLTFGALALVMGEYGVALFSFCLAGACFGFVWFNCPPAKVFMGDTGSLALGAALAGIALYTRLSFFLLIVGGIFLAEVLSDVIQVASYKTSGKRGFRMAPLHHHFELGGMLEPQIMSRFWMIGMVLGVLGVLGFFVK
ncbi:MAG TPA: phospho-N-acetylmuramoyl-pentapeptide-transferase [Bacillota bacterium]